MPAPISSISLHLPAEALRPAAPAAKPGQFEQVLQNSIQTIEQFQTQANQTVGKFLAGETEELHTAALATQKAELAFDLGLQVRNKIVDAYQEVMKMQM